MDGQLDEFRLVKPLGRGGMGEVFLGHDTVLDRAVAIKLIQGATDQGRRERFLIEARAIARLAHPNVVTIYRVGATESGHPFIVQELIRGRSLDQLSKPVAWREVCDIAIGIARGLDAAHRKGILHRDVKPANVMLDERNTPRLLDFGVAKLADDASQPAPVATVRPAPSADVDATRDLPRPTVELATLTTTAAPVPITQSGAVIGTPRYTAPELWCGDAASPQSDLYSLGVMLYELLAGSAPFPQTEYAALVDAVTVGHFRPLLELAPDTPAAIARLVTRCLARDPRERPSSSAELAHELEAVIADSPAVPEGNPYRGLRSFDAAHRGLFFGRSSDVRAVVDRLRSDPIVVLVGDSGIGKSSLCHAGVAPLVTAGGLGDGRTWRAVTVVPGRRPWQALRDALGLADADQPAAHLVRSLRGEDTGTLLVIDQLEELVTLGDPAEAARVADVLAAIDDGVPGVKALLAVRGDFLTRVASLPALGPPLTRGLHLLRVLEAADLREAVIGPARAKGVAFEDAATVTTLVESVAGNPGALPLLQFTLAALWEHRDGDTIPPRALAELGGVDGALARHADSVLRSLADDTRDAARELLLRLVTSGGTRAVRDRAELAGDANATAALEALVRGRLVVARDTVAGAPTYELAHEALIRSWGTLRDLLDAAAGQHAARNRLIAAATEWERLDRRADLLWSRHQLGELHDHANLNARELAFVTSSRRALRRRRIARGLAIAAVPAIALAVFAAVRYDTARKRATEVEARIEASDRHRAVAAELIARSRGARATAFASFDANRDGEPVWTEARRLAHDAAARLREAELELQAAYRIDADGTSEPMARILLEQADLATLEHDPVRAEELYGRAAGFAPELAPSHRAPARLVIDVDRPAKVALHRHAPDTPDVIAGGFAAQPIAVREGSSVEFVVEPGSYVAVIATPVGEVRDPVLLAAGDHLERRHVVPPPRPGFAYIPAGRFFSGSAAEELRLNFLTAQPLRERELPAFWIARTEVTYEDWLAYLRAIAPDEREQRRPRFALTQNTVELEYQAGAFTLAIRPTGGEVMRAAEHEPLVYPERTVRARVRWERMPVTGISYLDGQAYVTWLSETGKVPGARLCTTLEWERAARGADSRVFPHGDRLAVTDANFDETYGRRSLAFGPDEVGSFPRSDSPFGIADLAGNVWEATTGPDRRPWFKGGSFYQHRVNAMIANNSAAELRQRGARYGLRICADSARAR